MVIDAVAVTDASSAAVTGIASSSILASTDVDMIDRTDVAVDGSEHGENVISNDIMTT